MFKVYLPITKSASTKDNKLIIEGYASDSTIDRDKERFSEKAVKSMADYIQKGGIPVRVEHEDKIYTDIGVFTEGGVTKDGRLYVKGEINTELSLGKDMEVLLKMGKQLELSVGGRVAEISYEFDKSTNENIRVYEDIMLDEISIVKRPSNYNTELSLSKSVNWEASKKGVQVVKSEQARLLDRKPAVEKTVVGLDMYDHELLKGLITDEVEVDGKKKKKPKTMKAWLNEVESMIAPVLEKCWECELECEGCCGCDSSYNGLSADDYLVVTQLINIMANVDLPEDDDIPELLQDEEYWAAMSPEMQIVIDGNFAVMPHHNTDYTLNRELVLYQLKNAVSQQSWWTPSEFKLIVSHLYRHLRELDLVKRGKTTSEELVSKFLDSKDVTYSDKELALFEECYKYSEGLTEEVPTWNRGGLSEEAIKKCAEAYENLQSNSTNINNLSTMTKKENKDVEVTKAEEAAAEETVEAAEAPETETPETPEAEAPEEAAEAKEEKPTEDAPEAPEAEEAPEEEAAAEEEAPAAPEVDNGEVAKSVRASMEPVTKSLERLTDIVKSVVEDVPSLKKTVEGLADTVKSQGLIIEKLSELSLGRKSVATNVYKDVEKQFNSQNTVNKSLDDLITKYVKEGMDVKDARMRAREELAEAGQ